MCVFVYSCSMHSLSATTRLKLREKLSGNNTSPSDSLAIIDSVSVSIPHTSLSTCSAVYNSSSGEVVTGSQGNITVNQLTTTVCLSLAVPIVFFMQIWTFRQGGKVVTPSQTIKVHCIYTYTDYHQSEHLCRGML